MIIDLDRVKDRALLCEYITESEHGFNEQLSRAAGIIADDKKVRAVTLAGPTCAGKTTAASRLSEYLELSGKNAKLISIDDFYRSKEELARLGITDVEGVSAIDTEIFKTVAEQLCNFQTASIPHYDFITKTRPYFDEYEPTKNDIYIFEGIQAVYPEVLRCLECFKVIPVFINVCDGVDIGKVHFDSIDVRLIRRIVRDYHNRNASVEYTMSLWENVRLNEEKNIFPYVDRESIRINSLIPYEIFVLCSEFMSLTYGYTVGKPFFEKINSLRTKIEHISEFAVDASYVPENSLLREFTV